MLTERSPYVSVEEVETDIPSGSAIGIGITSVLLETWCAYELQWAVYERNTPPLWAQVIGHLRGYLGCLWVSGALQGDNAGEAFFVTCDQSTMTPADIHNGHLICPSESRSSRLGSLPSIESTSIRSRRVGSSSSQKTAKSATQAGSRSSTSCLPVPLSR